MLCKIEYGGGREILVRSLGGYRANRRGMRITHVFFKNNVVFGRKYGPNRKFPRRVIISNKEWCVE
jgi:hypothetical protein